MAETPENRHTIDAIVTLGLRLKPDGSAESKLLQRVDTAVDLQEYLTSHQEEVPLLIFSGGYSFSSLTVPPKTEARVMTVRAVARGVPRGMIRLEEDALCTPGSGILTRMITESLGLKRLVLVTDGDHMPYAVPIFRHFMGPGSEIIPVASSEPSPDAAQQDYAKSSAETLRAFIENTNPGDDAAIRAQLCKIRPAYIPIFNKLSSLSQLPQPTYLAEDLDSLALAA